jgi:hypothetical protein
MNVIQEKLNKIGMFFLRLVSAKIGLIETDSDSNKLTVDSDLSMPARGTALWLILLLFLPFHSDFLEDPNSTSFFNGYDFYNHEWSIPLRILLASPGLWVFFGWGKFTKCVFDKNENTFTVKQRINWISQKTEGYLSEISAIEVFSVEKPSWMLFQKETYTHIQVNLVRNSGEPVSFTFMGQRSNLDNTILKTHNMLCEFLNLPI